MSSRPRTTPVGQHKGDVELGSEGLEIDQVLKDGTLVWPEGFYASKAAGIGFGLDEPSTFEQLEDGIGTRHSQHRERPIKPHRPVVVPIPIPSPPEADAYLQPLQSWEGYVEDVRESVLLVRLVDGSGDDELAEIPVDEIPPADRDLIELGAVFYWTIGYRVSMQGEWSRVSSIRFRRLPVWTEDEIDTIWQSVETLGDLNEKASWNSPARKRA